MAQEGFYLPLFPSNQTDPKWINKQFAFGFDGSLIRVFLWEEGTSTVNKLDLLKICFLIKQYGPSSEKMFWLVVYSKMVLIDPSNRPHLINWVVTKSAPFHHIVWFEKLTTESKIIAIIKSIMVAEINPHKQPSMG